MDRPAPETRWAQRQEGSTEEAKRSFFPATQDSGECWISEALKIVMRERITGPNGSTQEWEITNVDEGPPAGNVLAIPAGFQELDDPSRQQ